MSRAILHRPTGTCEACSHFDNDPLLIEAEYPGLTAMSSGFASVRARDGLCRRHDFYLSAWDHCADFNAKAAPVSSVSVPHLKDRHEDFSTRFLLEDTASGPSGTTHRRLSQKPNNAAKVLAALPARGEMAANSNCKGLFRLVGLIIGFFR